jgi:hypothetical protein
MADGFDYKQKPQTWRLDQSLRKPIQKPNEKPGDEAPG